MRTNERFYQDKYNPIKNSAIKYNMHIIRVFKSRRLRLEAHASRKREGTNIFKILLGISKGNISLESPSVDRRILLESILKKYNRRQ